MNNRRAFESIQDAISNKDVALAKDLIDIYTKHSPDDLLLRNAKKKSLLQLAVECDLAEVADLLFSLQQSNASILFDEDGSGGNLLFQTVQHGMFTLTKELVAIAQRQSADTPGHRIWFKADSFNFTLLHAATYTQQSTDMLRFLLETAKDDPDFYKFIHQQTLNHLEIMPGSTALHIACSKNQPALAELLIRYGARLDITNDAGETPLEIIPNNDHEPFVLYLAERGALLGQKVNAVVADKLSSLSEIHDMLLVDVTCDSQPIPARKACTSPPSAARFVTDQTIDALISHCDARWQQLERQPGCVKLYFDAIFWHKNFLTFLTKKIKHATPNTYDLREFIHKRTGLPQDMIADILGTSIESLQAQEKLAASSSSLIEDDVDSNAELNIEITALQLVAEKINLAEIDILGLLVQDQQRLIDLIASCLNLETNLRARPSESMKNKIASVLITVATLTLLASIEAILIIKLFESESESESESENGNITPSTVILLIGIAIETFVGFFGTLYCILLGPLSRLWKKPPVVNQDEWESLLNEARDILKQLQFLREEETHNNNDQSTTVSYLPVEPNFLNEFEQHIAALATNLPITVAIPALSSLKDDLIKLHNRLKVTQKPFSLFSHPAKNTDAIVEIPSDDDEFEPEGDEEEVPLLRRNRSDNVDDGRPPARPGY